MKIVFALVSIAGGILILFANYAMISSGHVYIISLRLGPEIKAVGPSFWWNAGAQCGLGLAFVIYGLVYITTGDRYIPNMRENPTRCMKVVVLPGLIFALLSGFVLQYL